MIQKLGTLRFEMEVLWMLISMVSHVTNSSLK
jgi:hypothetical protein